MRRLKHPSLDRMMPRRADRRDMGGDE